MSHPAPLARQTTTLSMALQRELRDLRGEFLPFVEATSTLTVKRKDMAPAFMKLFKRYRKESGGTFVAFVHELDADMPVEREKYINHRSYQAALYLRRLIEAPHTTPQHRRTAPPFRVLAAVMTSLLYYTKKHEVEVWTALKRVSHWDDRQIMRLQALMKHVHPLALPGAPRLVKRSAHA